MEEIKICRRMLLSSSGGTVLGTISFTSSRCPDALDASMMGRVMLCFFNFVSVMTFAAEEMPGLLRSKKQLTVENTNKNISRTDSGVQDPVYRRALELKQELARGANKPFRDVVEAHVGDTAACGHKPITFIRQVTAIACLPDLLSDSSFPEDVKTRVTHFLQNCQGNSIGSLTDSAGLEMVRRHIAEFIQRRDNYPSHWEDIIIVPGVPAAIKILSKLVNFTANGLPPGALVPIPQFPLFTGTFADFGIERVGYYLDEDSGWSVKKNELDRAISEGRSHCFPRAIVVINPGNPTGQVLTRENIEEIVMFAEKEKLLIVACEVYQDNVYDEHVFHSFKKVMSGMGAPYNQTALVSLMSCSKGYAGETGLRGGYVELCNISPAFRDQLRKTITIADSPPVCAQIALDCVTNPPCVGEPSYPLFSQERAALLSSVGQRAQTLYQGVNSIPGLSCRPVHAAFFGFVKVHLPEKAVEKAKSLSQCPSTFYVLEMLENSGVVTVPGEEFGQKPGTYHFRITVLLPEETLKEALQRIRDFHLAFIEKYK